MGGTGEKDSIHWTKSLKLSFFFITSHNVKVSSPFTMYESPLVAVSVFRSTTAKEREFRKDKDKSIKQTWNRTERLILGTEKKKQGRILPIIIQALFRQQVAILAAGGSRICEEYLPCEKYIGKEETKMSMLPSLLLSIFL